MLLHAVKSAACRLQYLYCVIDWPVALLCCIINCDWLLASRVCTWRVTTDDWMNRIHRPTFKSMFGNVKLLSDSVKALFSTLVSSSGEKLGPYGKETDTFQLFSILNIFPCELGASIWRRGFWTGLKIIICGRSFGNNWNFRMMITRYRPVCKCVFW